jgi:hypothetical protein
LAEKRCRYVLFGLREQAILTTNNANKLTLGLALEGVSATRVREQHSQRSVPFDYGIILHDSTRSSRA